MVIGLKTYNGSYERLFLLSKSTGKCGTQPLALMIPSRYLKEVVGDTV